MREGEAWRAADEGGKEARAPAAASSGSAGRTTRCSRRCSGGRPPAAHRPSPPGRTAPRRPRRWRIAPAPLASAQAFSVGEEGGWLFQELSNACDGANICN